MRRVQPTNTRSARVVLIPARCWFQGGKRIPNSITWTVLVTSLTKTSLVSSRYLKSFQCSMDEWNVLSTITDVLSQGLLLSGIRWYTAILFDGSHVFRTQRPVSYGTVLTVLRTVASYFQLGAFNILLDMDFGFLKFWCGSALSIHLMTL
jgi:hypothetical protein